MSTPLTLGGVTYAFPITGDSAWGDDVTNWAIGVTQILNTIQINGDLGPTTNVTIQNNTTAAVTNLIVDSSINRAIFIEYAVYRAKGASEVAETGSLRAIYLTSANTWTLDRTYDSDAGMDFDINASGQVSYTSSNMTTTGSYVGNMRYRARVIPL